jgi:RNA polymerase sigma factor (sigma-70 family)
MKTQRESFADLYIADLRICIYDHEAVRGSSNGDVSFILGNCPAGNPERFDAAKGPLNNWLVIVARSRALDLLRRVKAKTRREAHLTLEVLAIRSSVMQSLNPDQALMIQELLSRLPPQQEWVIRRAYFDGFALGEIAERQQLPLGTVKGRARFAIKRLRSELSAPRIAS